MKKKSESEKIREKMDEVSPLEIRIHNPLSYITSMQQEQQIINKLTSQEGFKKTAGQESYVVTNDINTEASTTPITKSPLVYIDPMFDPILFLFPKDRLDEINKRLRHYYETNPIVGSAIDLHVSVPITDFSLECANQKNQNYWNDWKDRIGLMEYLRAMIHDYWLLGESFLVPIWDMYNYEISHFNQYPPENIDIIQTYVTPKKMFLLKPDPKLKEKLKSASEFDQRILAMMDPDFVEALKRNKPYFLGDSDKVIYLARTTTKYRSRGISILSRCLKDLLYIDKLRLLQLTFADRHLFPMKIFKLGSAQHGWIPSKSQFIKLQNLLAQNASDPNFSLLWHFGLEVEYVGTKDKIANLIPEFEFAYKNIMAGLFVNEELIHGGVSATVRDNTHMRVLMQRYNEIREKIERVLILHVFLPVARLKKMYKGNVGDYMKSLEKNAINYAKSKNIKLGKNGIAPWDIYVKANQGKIDISAFDIPRPIWKRINIFNNITEQQNIINLEEKGKIPLSYVLEMLGFDPAIVQKKLEEEESTRFDRVYREVKEELSKTQGIREKILEGKKIKDILKETPPDVVSKEPGTSFGESSSGGLFGGLGDLGGLGGGPAPSTGDLGGLPPLEVPQAPETPSEIGGGLGGIGELPKPTAEGGGEL